MKTNRREWMTWMAVSAVAALAGCGGGEESLDSIQTAAGRGRGGQSASLSSQLASLPVEELSAAETAGLLAMREEEQLAHDVYVASAGRWSLPVFGNIASSETTHAGAVADLLGRYAVPDPMAGVAIGVFPTPEMQALYDELTARSAVSLVAALEVGCEIEELDMRDIAAHLLAVDNADIRLVYDHLMRGSRNHLRSFYSALLRQGGNYLPKYLSQAEFDAIVTSAMESGA